MHGSGIVSDVTLICLCCYQMTLLSTDEVTIEEISFEAVRPGLF